ncbi:MAG: hypothetical protein U1F53_07475 [Burkholderiaceae bacterium]
MTKRCGLGWRARALVATLLVLVAGSAAARSGLGLNLTGWDYYSPDFPIIDQFKRASVWLTQCDKLADAGCRDFAAGTSDWDTGEQAKLDLDEEGWVKSLPRPDDRSVRYRTVAVILFHGDGRAHPAGKYVVTYEGKGQLGHALIGRRVDALSRPGRDVVEVTNHTDDGWRIAITATDPRNPIRHIRIFPPGGACQQSMERYAAGPADCDARRDGRFVPFESFPPESVWHPRFLQDLRGFRVLRFMDWGKTNTAPTAEWSARPRMSDPSWGGSGGVPVEAMLDLSRAVGAQAWLNLPMRASDAYVREFARLLRQKLPPGQQVVVEYANEPWNMSFPAYGWMLQQARLKWPAAAADPALAVSWHAWRTARICQAIKAEWPSPEAAPVRCVLNVQAASPWLAEQALLCRPAAAELGKACGNGVDAMAIAPYFGGYVSQAATRWLTASWPQDADGGLARLFTELTGTDASGKPVSPPLNGRHPDDPAPQGALEQARRWMVDAKALADKHGLPLWAYEAGQHLTMPPGSEDPAWLALISEANRDRRMGQAYLRYMADWRAAGGQTLVLFAHAGVPSKWGAWGLKETQFNDAFPKWQAALMWRDREACWWPGC